MDQSFLDPLLTEDKKPYGPIRYKQIVKECYLISKHTNTSYTDLMDVTPTERNYLIQLIAEEIQKSQEAIDKAKQESKLKAKKTRKTS